MVSVSILAGVQGEVIWFDLWPGDVAVVTGHGVAHEQSFLLPEARLTRRRPPLDARITVGTEEGIISSQSPLAGDRNTLSFFFAAFGIVNTRISDYRSSYISNTKIALESRRDTICVESVPLEHDLSCSCP